MTGGEGATEWSSRNTDGGTDRAERTEGREGDRTGGNGPRKRERGRMERWTKVERRMQ